MHSTVHWKICQKSLHLEQITSWSVSRRYSSITLIISCLFSSANIERMKIWGIHTYLSLQWWFFFLQHILTKFIDNINKDVSLVASGMANKRPKAKHPCKMNIVCIKKQRIVIRCTLSISIHLFFLKIKCLYLPLLWTRVNR